MSTSCHVAKAIHDMGKGAILSKMDHVSAYKLLNLVTFIYKVFVGLVNCSLKIFGSISSLPNNDDLHQSFSDLVKARTGTDAWFLFRCLDDQVVITSNLDDNKKFVDHYIKFAYESNLPLAEMAGEDIAFLFRTSGTVFGVYFNTLIMTWSYSESKRLTHMKINQDTIKSIHVSLKQLQKVAGFIDTLVLLCPPLKFLRGPLLNKFWKLLKLIPNLFCLILKL